MTVGDVAKLAHISVRTLHHYDEIGLLKPSRRTESGYRLYTNEDLVKLQQILFYKELGFRLDEIKDLMDNPDFDRYEALLEQRRMISQQVSRLQAMLHLVDKTIASINGGVNMNKEEMFEVFGDFDPTEYQEEVKERWGHTEAYQESMRRTKGYSKADWQRFNEESKEITLAIAELMDQGVPPTDERAMDAVERHRLQIDQWFYPCSREMHAELGKMYIADPRFTATYEKIRPSMAQYVHDAIMANLARA